MSLTNHCVDVLSIIFRKTRNKTRRIGIRIPKSNVLSSVANEAITKEMHDGLGRATTTTSSLEAKQGSRKVIELENELNSTKTVHNKALITLTKRGRMIEEIDEDENVNLVKSSKQGEAHDTAGHRMESDDTEVVDFSTASPQNDDDEVTLAETLIGHDEELAQKLHVVELVKDIARQEQEQERYDFKKALELQKQLDEREKVVAKSQARDIDWSDPIVLRYHAVQNRSFFIAEIEKEVMKRSGFDLQQESLKQVKEEIVQQDDVVSKQVVKESYRKAEGRVKRKTLKARKDKDKR
ncbi:hypothetical protein Tco_1117198 [Tanacetum coccineum]